MLPSFIKPHVEGFKFQAGREKTSGCMWEGKAKATVNGVEFTLQLHHHGSNNETAETLVDHLSIGYVNGKNSYWHCVWDDTSLWMHPTGWFPHAPNWMELADVVPRVNPIFHWRTFDRDRMIELGFEQLI